MKKPINVNITPEELKAICKEYEFDENEDMMGDERTYMAKKALSLLPKSDYIIFCLYLHYQSERKLASLLNCSRTPINREIKKIRADLNNIILKLC